MCLKLDKLVKSRSFFRAKEHTLDVFSRTHIMGVLNVTPDSFSDGGNFFVLEKAIEHALEMVANGADIIDIGGESSRPGAANVSTKEELGRVLPILKTLAKKISVPISVDTYKPLVADVALKEGAHIVNDISGFTEYPEMADVVSKNDAGVVLMHMLGKPCNMQHNPQYLDVVGEIRSFLEERKCFALERGISEDRIMIDPGIGFGKTVFHNLVIIKELAALKDLGLPILVGTSRKSFIGKVLNLPPDDRLNGTIATVCVSIMNGANVVRVHDVKSVKAAALMVDALVRPSILN